MKLRVKICGITNIDDAMQAVEAGADTLGFIFYEESPRFISPSSAASIIRALPSFITPVGVFVNEHRAVIERTITETHLRIIQLSGDETPEQCAGYAVDVWKAFRINDVQNVNIIQEYKISAAMLDGASGNLYGGSGTRANVPVAVAMKQYHPLILSGGLNPENIVEAIHAVRPSGIDVNSGVEISPGKKDIVKLQRMFENINRLNLSSL